MPGLVATLDFHARPDLLARHAGQLQASRWAPHHRVERWCDASGRVALGRADLAVWNRGRQPIASRDGRYHLVFQGDLYDRQALLAALADRGVPLTGSDNIDLLLGTYLADGLAGVAKLNGSYFFVLWDAQDGLLTAGSDRYATRPHFYAWEGGRLVLAPDVRGVLAGLAELPAVNHEAIAEFLALEYPLDEGSYYQGVQAFPAGTFLQVSPHGQRWLTYWQPRYVGPDEARPRPEGEWLEQATDLYRQAVKRCLGGNVVLPLSGGTDSRSILAFADRELPLFTFGDEASEDVRFARAVAAELGLEHHYVPLTPDYLSRYAPEMLARGEGMVSLFHAHDADGWEAVTALGDVTLAGMTAEYMRLDFADNVLAEPARGKAHKLALLARHLLNGHRPLTRFGSEAELAARLSDYVASMVTPELAGEVLSPELAVLLQLRVPMKIAEVLGKLEAPTAEDRLMAYNVTQRQRRFSQYGLRIGTAVCESRKPLDDYDLIDFVLTMPPATRRKLQTRVICHAHPRLASLPRTGSGVAMNAGLPARAAAYARKQLQQATGRVQSFGNPQEALRTISRGFYEDVLLDPATLANGLVHGPGLASLVHRHMAREVDAASALCAIATLELWRREQRQLRQPLPRVG